MSHEPLVLAVDASTTACKAIAWNANGVARAEGRASLRLENPEPDGYEQDADEWWRATTSAVRSVTDQLGPASAREIQAVCVTHQRETFVLTDPRGVALHPALVWMDARCRAEVTQACERIGRERLTEISGKPPCTTPSLYKLLWLVKRHPELLGFSPRLHDVHGYLVMRLTGEFKTSLASADLLGLVDLRARQFCDELLDLAGLTPEQVPELAEPGRVLGTITAEAARAWGVREGLPVIAGAGDGQAASLGAGNVDSSRAYLNLGTAIVSGVVDTSFRVARGFRTLYAALPGYYLLETDLKGGTFIVNWLTEHLLGAGPSALEELERRAAELPVGSEGLLLVPYWNGVMNPYWDDDATGITLGWHGGHGSAHLFRATLEGIAFEQRLATEAVEQALGRTLPEFIVMGGGARSALWCQMLADVLQRRITRASTPEATALGAGMVAAVAIGLHPDFPSAARVMTSTGASFDPGPAVSRYADLFAIYRDVYPALTEVTSRLAAWRAGKPSARWAPPHG